MTFFKRLTFLCLAVAMALASCKKDDDQPSGAMTADVDGTGWKSKTVGAVMQGGLTNVTGVAADGSIVTLTIFGQEEGVYSLEQTESSAGIFTEGNNQQGWASNQGNDVSAYVKITEINVEDSTISGEFQFTAYRLLDETERVLTNGKFTNVKFTGEVSTTGEDFLKAKIDGDLFNASLVAGYLNGSTILIVGSSSSGTQSIGLNLSKNITTGEHELEGIFGENSAQYNPDQSTYMSSISGKVKITKHDKTAKIIAGTFEFEAAEVFGGSAEASIGNGSFLVSY